MSKSSVYFSIVVSMCFMVFVGCKSTKSLVEGENNLSLSAKEVLKENKKRLADFKTLQSKVRLVYKEGQSSQTHTITLRMKKDEIIWITAAFNVIRAQVTPEKVSFYNKLDNTYFDGDFAYISKILGTQVDFKMVQNILMGESLFELNRTDFDMSINDNSYLFQPKDQTALFELFYIISGRNFKMKSQQLAQSATNRFLEIDYLSYQQVEKEVFPENLRVISLEKDQQTTIELEYKSISLNEDLRFPFKIPSGFEEIELE
ncbi:DUF4292 domain-containing protein [Mangrovimonas sp. ST2L15]|uniref:DUF4292 domain-containing protein n=1 Tax=Mangrovimonas sp. ST2L15 TaxID=1645916 RepID=UPI0006B4C255|nr:DUF4292 domain-containing protein [Mangrovimonas sp. ST2L15]